MPSTVLLNSDEKGNSYNRIMFEYSNSGVTFVVRNISPEQEVPLPEKP